MRFQQRQHAVVRISMSMTAAELVTRAPVSDQRRRLAHRQTFTVLHNFALTDGRSRLRA